MSRAKTFDIDGEKLKNLILATGHTLKEASIELGGSEKYLAGVCREGKATAQCMSLIGLALAIPKDLYIIKEPEPEAPAEETGGIPFTAEDYLSKIMQLLETIVENMEVKNNEQKVWNLPFSEHPDNYCVDGRDL